MATTKAKILRKSISSDDLATNYAQKVCAKEIIAGPDIRAACKRHLDDLENGSARGLFYDQTKAREAYGFFHDVLKLNGGDFEGVPFILQPWQAFVVGSIFGWCVVDGTRRFRVVYVETGKGSGKSPLAAGVGLKCLVADGENRAEVYAAATKKDQAMVLFRDAVAMVSQSPAMNSRITKSGTGLNAWNLAFLQTGSFFKPISSDDGQSGPRPHCALIDEVHEHKTSVVVEMMRAGTKGRKQALIFMITNSGYDRTSVCFQYHEYGREVAAQIKQDDSFFSFICSLDEGDDPFTDESCWAKANPSLGITFQKKYLDEQVREARGMPSKESMVRRLNFCEWVDAENPWIDGDLWRACEQDFDLSELAGRRGYGGLDLSGTRDLTALAIAFKNDDGTVDAFVDYWTPGDTVVERGRIDRVPYEAWIRAGHMTAPPGRSVDYSFVAHRVMEMQQDFDLQAIAFDPYRIKYFENDLIAANVECALTPHGQGYYKSVESGLWMPHSIELLEELVMKGRLRVKLNPCLRWNSASAVLEADPKNNRIFTKRKSKGRIDGLVALCMAIGLALNDKEVESVYETRGIRML